MSVETSDESEDTSLSPPPIPPQREDIMDFEEVSITATALDAHIEKNERTGSGYFNV